MDEIVFVATPKTKQQCRHNSLAGTEKSSKSVNTFLVTVANMMPPENTF